MTACLDDEVMAAWSAAALPAPDIAAAIEHAAACPRCAAVIAAVIDGEVATVTTVGNYQLRQVLGVGGMGVVFDAWDPVLSRPAAVKMIRARADERGEHARLIEEGRALARLAHRHVVAVYQCDAVGDEVYVAMAKVVGQPLDRWLASAAATRAARLAVLGEVADGLAAIHAAGLVHRDLKPSNVVVGDDGHAVIIDLGLARSSDRPAIGRGSGVAGTLRYLAPEVAAGGVATAASDQHAWWQLVAEAVPPSTRRRDRRLARVVARGLAIDPAARYPSMRAAATAFAAAVRARRVAPWLVGGGVVAAGIAAAIALWPSMQEARGGCPSSRGASLTLGADLIATLTAKGHDAATIVREVRRRADAADALGREACRDERSRDPARARLASQRRACVDAIWHDTEETLEGVRHAAPHQLDRAIEDLAVAPPIEACLGGAVPSTPAPPPAAQRPEVERLEAALRHARTAQPTARDQHLATLDALGPAILAIEHAPLTATWHHDRADALRQAGRLDELDAELVAASNLAARAGDDDLRARALINRLRTAFMLGRSDVAALEAEADAAVERMRNPAMRAELDVSLARVRVVGGRAPDAVALLARALAVYDHLAITAPRRTTAVLQDLGAALQVTGDLDGAQTALDRGYALATAALGADADETVELRGARATNLMYRDQPEAAAELAAVAAAMARSSPGPSAGRVAVESYRCELAIAQRDVVTGTAACRDTVAHAEALFGADSPRLTWPLLVLGRFLAQTGELRAAAARFERAIALSAAGAETPVLPALARGQLALTYRALGDRRAAVQTAEARAALAPLAADPEAAALLDELR